MKMIFTILLIAVFTTAFTQTPILPIDSTTNLITYSAVVEAKGTKDELFSRAREWFAKTYNSAQSVIQMEDKDKIIGRALTQVYRKVAIGTYEYGYVNYTISIYFKDDKYKYEVTNLYHTGQSIEDGRIPDFGPCEEMMNEKKKHLQKIYYNLLIQADINIKALISGLKKDMSTATVAKDSF